MDRGGRISLGLLIVGALALIVGAMLPWVSWVGLWGEAARGAERLAIGWEGDGITTAACGVVLLAAAWFVRARPGLGVNAAILVAAAVVLWVVAGDLHRITEIGPAGGIAGNARVGLYLTAAGGLAGLAAGVLAMVRAPLVRPSPSSPSR